MTKKILSLLVLLLTAASGAWATDPTVYTGPVAMSQLKVGDILAPGFSLTGNNNNSIHFNGQRHRVAEFPSTDETATVIGYIISINTLCVIKTNDYDFTPVDENGNDGYAWEVTAVETNGTKIWLSGIYYTAAIPTTNANEWTLTMPGSNVLLTPIYSAATVYQADGMTEKKAYASLKEAFAAVQSGDVIKLDYHAKQTESMQTPSTGNGVKFTIDFNGYTIKNQDREDLLTLTLHNSGDEITFIDSSDGQTGGYKGITNFENGSRIIIAGGRYNLNDQNAETLNQDCLAEGHFDLAPGMQFVDLEGGATANNGFNVRATYKDINLTIGSKRFATFYAATNFKLADNTPDGVGIYTITKINDTDGKHTSATATQLGSVIANNTPMLVYNGTDAQQTVTLQASTAAATATTVKPIDEFKGTFVDRAFTDADMAAADYYALSGGKAFAPVKGSGTLGANKCWLQFDKQQTGNAPASLMIVFEDGDLTEVNEVIGFNEVNDDTIYDLSGRKVGSSFNVQRSTLKKGVYIKNGQKVVK